MTVEKRIQKILKPMVILIVGFFIFGADQVHAKKSIKKLTSKENAKDVHDHEDSGDELVRAASANLNKHSIGIGIGQTNLKGDFKHNGSDKITFDMYYDYSASYSFDFVTNLHFSSHKTQEKKVSLNGIAFGIKGKAFQFDSFAPYLIAGLGFYSPKVTRYVGSTLMESESKITFGTHFGLGAELRLNPKAKVGVIGHIHNPFDVKQEDGTPEIEGSYFKLLILAHYTF